MKKRLRSKAPVPILFSSNPSPETTSTIQVWQLFSLADRKLGGITHGEVDGTDTEAIFEDEDRMVSSIENAFTERQGHIPDLVELETEIHGEPIR